MYITNALNQDVDSEFNTNMADIVDVQYCDYSTCNNK